MNNIKIGWVLAVDRNHASSRLQGYLVDEWLKRNGVDSQVLLNNSQNITGVYDSKFWSAFKILKKSNCSHIVFESPEWPILQLSQLWRKAGGVSLGVRCDLVKAPYDDYFDATILPTETLADALQISRRKIIPDSVEVPSTIFKESYSTSNVVKVVWMGHQSYERYIVELVNNLRKNSQIDESFEFNFISKGSFATKQWAEDTVLQHILENDIAILPIPQGEWFKSKSSNRLALMMALGMPVIASRIQSYTEIVLGGTNAVLIDNEQQLGNALLSLKDQKKRALLGSAARADIGSKFSMENIGLLWLDAIRSTESAADFMPQPSTKMKLLSLLARF